MRINYLKVYTAKLGEQKEFYQKVLGLAVIAESKKAFKVKVGFSVLEFEYKDVATPYHIAFHIPAHRQEQALSWLQERVGILTGDGTEIIDFPGWQAKSIYFYDEGKNILEFISRRHLFPSEENKFSAMEILGISEIGVATDDVKQTFEFLNSNFGLGKFTGDYERFCATGDDEGLFIVINRYQKDWIPVGDKAFASPFQVEITADGATLAAVYKNERLELL